MPFVKSRVNGLRIAIPNDARNVIHRFAIQGGGNELVFDNIKRSDYESSRRSEGAPIGLGSEAPAPTTVNADREDAVELTVGFVEDDEAEAVSEEIEVVEAAEEKKAPARARPKRNTRKATPSTDDDEIEI